MGPHVSEVVQTVVHSQMGVLYVVDKEPPGLVVDRMGQPVKDEAVAAFLEAQKPQRGRKKK